MRPVVVTSTLLFCVLTLSPVTARAADRLPLEDFDSKEAAVTRDRCLGSGAAGAALGALGLAIGGGVALGISEIIKVSDPANTSASKQFGNFAIPLGAIGGGLAGLALGTIGAWELGEDLAGKPSVTR
jgi:hypothetical protein